MTTQIFVGDLATLNLQPVPNVLEMRYSWTLDQESQFSFDVVDPNFTMMEANYFQPRRNVVVENNAFTISTIRTSQGQGSSPLISVEARRIGIQALRLDKNPTAVSASTATEYVKIQAERVGLQFQGENTSVVPNLTAVSESVADESVWDVITSLAGEAQFVVFENDNTLYFASERWLLGKYGIPLLTGDAGILLSYPSLSSGASEPFDILEVPEFYTSDQDPYAAEFKCVMARTNGTQLRPGMTAVWDGVPRFRGRYLITEVSYDLDSPNPVSVSGRTPEAPRDKDGKKQPEYREALG